MNVEGNQAPAKTTENVKTIQGLIHEDCRQTIHELADKTGISYGVCQEILRESMNMRHITAKFVPQLLTNDQKQRHINMCFEL
jgi:hypothetical protein